LTSEVAFLIAYFVSNLILPLVFFVIQFIIRRRIRIIEGIFSGIAAGIVASFLACFISFLLCGKYFPMYAIVLIGFLWPFIAEILNFNYNLKLRFSNNVGSVPWIGRFHLVIRGLIEQSRFAEVKANIVQNFKENPTFPKENINEEYINKEAYGIVKDYLWLVCMFNMVGYIIGILLAFHYFK
jgi:hypothetical protein